MKRPKRGRPRGPGSDVLHPHQELAEQLLRESLTPGLSQTAGEVSKRSGIPYSTVTGRLRALREDGVIVPRWFVSPLSTRFSDEYQIAIQIDAHAIADTDTDRCVKLGIPELAGKRGVMRRFVREIIYDLSGNPTHRDIQQHIMVMDAVILHGSADRDVAVRVLTDDGIHSLARYIQDVLLPNRGVRSAGTSVVEWRFSLRSDLYPFGAEPSDAIDLDASAADGLGGEY